MMVMVLTGTPFLVFALVAFARSIDPQTGRIYRSRETRPVYEHNRLDLLSIDIAEQNHVNKNGTSGFMYYVKIIAIGRPGRSACSDILGNEEPSKFMTNRLLEPGIGNHQSPRQRKRCWRENLIRPFLGTRPAADKP